MLSKIYELYFLNCFFGDRLERSVHGVVQYINRMIRTRHVNYVLEQTLKDFSRNLSKSGCSSFSKTTLPIRLSFTCVCGDGERKNNYNNVVSLI